MTSPYWYPLASPTLGEEEIAAATDVLRSSQTTMGARVEEFEEAFARRVGARHAVMVNSGSSADLLIAFALDLHGEVLVPAVTWPTHLWSWRMAGATSVLVDVDDLNATVETIAAAIGPDAVAISLVHLMGVPVDLGPILDLANVESLYVTEDCCEALGATYGDQPVGTFGAAAAWSFFFSHHITTMEGGMVTTDDEQLATKIRTLRSHGWARHLPTVSDDLDPRYTFIDWGFNLRPTEVAAAIGLVQLGRLDGFLAARQENFAAFASSVAENPLVHFPEVPEIASASWFGIPMLVESGLRDDLAHFLESEGIETRPILAGNLMRQPVLSGETGTFPGADRVHDGGLYIGLTPFPTGDVEEVAARVNKFCEQVR